MKELKNNRQKGITLIALVVTIVVLIILATVSILAVFGDNGIIARAQTAKDTHQKGKADETNTLDDYASYIGNYLDGKGGGSGGSDYDPASEGVPIPAGFVYVGGTKASGLVISDNAADKEKYKGQTTVGTDLQGNQFVWIPVENIADYKRTAYRGNSLSSHSETLADDEKTSVETNKGYYIGRYEAGDQESTNSKTLRTSSSSTSNKITVKAGQAPYNYIKYIDAKKLAEGFSTKQKYTSVKSKLVSSYAWDTAIEFIQKTNPDYGSSSEEGNYKNSPTFTYTGIADTEKNKQTKANGTGTLIPTGQTTAVNNIYDMGGNVFEWTTESYYFTNVPYTYRGGDYNDEFDYLPAGDRGGGDDYPYVSIGFRCTLYL